MCTVRRINLKTSCKDEVNGRADLLDYCLNHEKQWLAIGWSECTKGAVTFQEYIDLYKMDLENTYREKLKENSASRRPRVNHVINVFQIINDNDLFWTRDLYGYYWICRVIGKPEVYYNEDLDIGAVVPVKAYKCGLEVPGQIKSSFNRPNGGTCEDLPTGIVTEYTKYVYNQLSQGKEQFQYQVMKKDGNLLDNLPEFELEELVISYLQIKENYYVLSNSIAKKSTTVHIECEMISRDPQNIRKAVVQVKAREFNAADYLEYVRDGFYIYLYAQDVKYSDNLPENVVIIRPDQLLEFYKQYKSILPESITKWENLFI